MKRVDVGKLEALFDKLWDRVCNGPTDPRQIVATMIYEARALIASTPESGDRTKELEEKLIDLAGKANEKLHKIFRETDGHAREYCVHGYLEEFAKEAISLSIPDEEPRSAEQGETVHSATCPRCFLSFTCTGDSRPVPASIPEEEPRSAEQGAVNVWDRGKRPWSLAQWLQWANDNGASLTMNQILDDWKAADRPVPAPAVCICVNAYTSSVCPVHGTPAEGTRE